MAITTDQNTELARKLGLLGANESAGGGLVQQRLQEAAKTNPNVLSQYEQERTNIQGSPFQASTVRTNLTQPAKKTGATVSELRNVLSGAGQNLNAYEAQLSQWGAGQGNANFFGTTSGYQSDIDALYNKYAKPQTTQLPAAPTAPTTPAQPTTQQPVYQPPTYQASAPKSYQDYYQEDVKQLEDLTAPNKVNRPDEMALPEFLRELSPYSGQQIRSNIATKGIYGGGVEDVGSRYFLNSLLREYLNQDNQATGYDLLPVEEQYLQSMGVPITSSTGSEDFLRQLGLYYKQLGGL
jgi:hypothetical protein